MLWSLLCTLSAVFGLPTVTCQLPTLDTTLATRYFQEAKWACDDDAGKLWGRSLWGPMIFADPTTRSAVLSEAAPDFIQQGSVWTGHLPKEISIANFAIKWQGKKWTMVMWPLPTNRGERARLMCHELFHRIQEDLGLPAASPSNAHLDSLEGRLWLQLEGRALAKALTALISADRDEPMRDALLFRAKRQSLFPSAKREEDALELNEGLAEYTGFMLKGSWEPEARLWLGRQMQTSFDNRDTYTRNFAYRTGPAYAFLMNAEENLRTSKSTWRTRLHSGGSISDLLAALITSKPDLATAEVRAKLYGYTELLNQEERRAINKREQEQRFTKMFIEGPVLVIPFTSGNFSFDPNSVFPFGTHGTVYAPGTLIDNWGTLTATEGVLISPDFKTAWVPAPTSVDFLSGPGWTLKLNGGWKVVPGMRKGDYTLTKG